RSNLSDVNLVSEFPFLITIEMAGNQVKDLAPLSSLQYLVQIDFSDNQLTEDGILFKGPYNLQDINLGRNRIASLDPVSHHRFLNRINLDYNQIRDLSSLSNCLYLKTLSIVGNQVASLLPLKNLPLKYLDAKQNQLLSLEGIEGLLELQDVYLDDNQIRTLDPLCRHPRISALSLKNNSIDDIQEIATLDTLPLLRYLALDQNPLQANSKAVWDPVKSFPLHSNAAFVPSFRLYIVNAISKLSILDGVPISPEERVAAINHYSPPTEVSLSIQHVNHQKLQARNYATIRAVDLLRAKRLSPIVLFGPSGVGKRTLTRRLLEEFPHIYGLAVSHTTRPPRDGEEHGKHYYFATKAEMERMNTQGKFLEFVTLFGN
ncbi:hypothetical protein HDU91_003324, partial [Kappamyces sp. JEL0680]